MIDFAEKRRRLLAEITEQAAETATWTGRAAFSDTVMDAMGRVPREAFVPEADRLAAYVNRPLPIGHGQTISQPYIVALMTDLLDLGAADRVLEIGTGCGYQSAVLAEVAGAVYSVETVEPLADAARRRLARLGYDAVHIHTGDGNLGWPEEAPFDAVIVTAAAKRIPPALIEQLRAGGRMVIPVGAPSGGWGGSQTLVVGKKDSAGKFSSSPTLPVAFVPLVERMHTDERKSLY